MTQRTLRLRVAIVAAAVIVVAAAGIAGASLLGSSPDRRATPASRRADLASTSTTVVATTSPDPNTFAQPAPTTLPRLPPGGLGPGSDGTDVQAYQERLTDLHFDPGAIDGEYGDGMAYAVEALQKVLGLEPTGTIAEPERLALMTFRYPEPLQAGGEPDRTELDVTKQVITLYEDRQVRLITTTSTGSGEEYCSNVPRDNPTQRVCELANTPSGRFTFREYRDGWDRSPLGRLYNPFYFNGGIAIHGYPEVPIAPASHGCARIPMHIAEYFHTLVHVGEPVYVFGGSDAKVLSSTPIETTTTTEPPPEPPPATTPTTSPTPPSTSPPESTTTTSTSTTTTTTPDTP